MSWIEEITRGDAECRPEDIYVTLIFGKSVSNREERDMIDHHAKALSDYRKDEKRLSGLIENKPDRKRRTAEYAVKSRKCNFSDGDIPGIGVIARHHNFMNRTALEPEVELPTGEVMVYV
jgi:hypothetical protein